MAPGAELKSRESLDRHCVGLDTAHVTEDDAGAALFQQSANAPVEPGQVGAGNGAADREADRLRR